jgi:uncharacterized protein (TIGR03435 family)
VTEHAGRNRRWILLLAVFLAPAICQAAAQDVGGSQGQGAAARPLAFDVVSIKPDKSEVGPFTIGFPADGDGLVVTNIPLGYIIQFAYDFERGDLVTGLPEWARSDRYDIQAKVAAADLAAWREMSDGNRRVMVQGILADSFKLKIRRVPTETPVYELVVGKSGSKLKEAKPGDPKELKGPDGKVIRGMLHTGAGQFTAQDTPMSELALTLSDYADRQVVDKTGLAGKYDFTLQFTPEPGHGPEYRGAAGRALNGAAPESAGPTVYTAVQEQLGLKMEPAKTSVEGLAIDHVERPAAN